jgi:GntR family transcriptional regulator, transcriptional repressor for pyruvate dehydrogenase complex
MSSDVAPTPAEDGFGQPLARSPRLSDKVAEAMLETILERQLRPGDPLPSERELGEQYGVSRTVVREAVRALTARGVVDARAGRGLTVAQVDAEDVSTSMRLYLHGLEEIPYEMVHEARAMIEIQIAGQAAERATDEELAELQEIAEGLRRYRDDPERRPLLDVEFHRTLARLTHNELYLIMLDSIGDILLEIRRATFALPNDAERAHRQHKRIVEAVVKRDPEAAREAMREHLTGAVEEWEKLGAVPLKTPE